MKSLIKVIISIALVASVVGLTACSESERKDTGMVAGGVVGGVAGSALSGGNTAATIGGAVVGGYVGRQVTN